jgi:phenylacetate-coenzyme A ligase PaaK-like adenylate-forming protein
MRYIIYGSRLWGAKLAKPEYVGLEEAVKVARWMADTKKQFGGCCLACSPSRAVMVCQAAVENGLDIQGTHFTVGGEPLTPAKRRQIETTGASVTPRYVMSEIGQIGYGCLEASAADDVHLFHDSTALIQHQRKVEHADIQVNAFLLTTLLPSAPKILLNMESDDYGVVETSKCGCLFGQLGFDTHIHDIRSFAKLTGSGLTIVDTDFVRILEEVLPSKYGGAATDYQLLEEEDGRGQTHLDLIISPGVGELDEGEVIATVLRELRKAPYPGKLAAGVWSQANTMQIKRIYPISKMGKVMTLHLMKK